MTMNKFHFSPFRTRRMAKKKKHELKAALIALRKGWGKRKKNYSANERLEHVYCSAVRAQALNKHILSPRIQITTSSQHKICIRLRKHDESKAELALMPFAVIATSSHAKLWMTTCRKGKIELHAIPESECYNEFHYAHSTQVAFHMYSNIAEEFGLN